MTVRVDVLNIYKNLHIVVTNQQWVVRWSWVNFLDRGVLLIWIIVVGQGSIALAVDAGRFFFDIFTLLNRFTSFLPLSGRRLVGWLFLV